MKYNIESNLAFYMFYVHWLTQLDAELYNRHGIFIAALPRFKPNLRKPYLFRAFTKASYALRYLLHADAGDRKGVAQLMQVPIALVETDEFYVLSLALNSECTPAILSELALPTPATFSSGLIIESCGVPWMDSYLAIQYSMLMKWVAVGSNGCAIVVFSLDDAKNEGEVVEY